MKRVLIALLLLATLVGGTYAVKSVMEEAAPVSTPTPVAVATTSPSPSPISTPSPIPTPVSKPATSVLLNVPFTIQAPDSQWIEPWKEGCEEAALLMADAYNKGDRQERLPVAETKVKIAEMVEWQKQRFGGHYDIGIDMMATVAKEYMGYADVTVKHEATLEDIRNELRRGKPVIVPAAGRLLGNPYFTPPGPPYHVFVIVGFDENGFIVNENGTRQGRQYRYSNETLENAIHDYKAGSGVTDLPKAYLVLEK